MVDVGERSPRSLRSCRSCWALLQLMIMVVTGVSTVGLGSSPLIRRLLLVLLVGDEMGDLFVQEEFDLLFGLTEGGREKKKNQLMRVCRSWGVFAQHRWATSCVKQLSLRCFSVQGGKGIRVL